MKMTIESKKNANNASNKGRKLRYQKGVTFLAHTVDIWRMLTVRCRRAPVKRQQDLQRCC